MASSAVPASATTSKPSSPSRSGRSPLRTTAWSSARTILMSSATGAEPNYVRECGALRMWMTSDMRTLLGDMTAARDSNLPRRTRVVLAGGGVAALEAMLALRGAARDLVDVTLVANTDTFAYRSLEVGEAFGVGRPHRYPLAALVAGVGGRFVQESIASVRVGARELLLADGDRLPFDALLLALGARSVPAFEHGVTFSLDSFEETLDDLREQFAQDVTIVV